jgi:hypothetical protein
MVGLHRMVWAVQELQRLARASPASLEPIRRDQVRHCSEARLAPRRAIELRALVLLCIEIKKCFFYLAVFRNLYTQLRLQGR